MIEQAHAIARTDERLPICPRRPCATIKLSQDALTRLLEHEYCQEQNRVYAHGFNFSLVDWLLIGCVTWKDESRRKDTLEAAEKRSSDFKLLETHSARRLGVRWRHWPSAWAEEYDESGKELHRHFLIGKKRLAHVDPWEVARMMERLWTCELHPFDSTERKIGTAKIEPYDYETHWLDGVYYVAKRQRRENGQELEKVFGVSPVVRRLILAGQPKESQASQCHCSRLRM